VTADHGNDPSTPSTDHSREHVPVFAVGALVGPGVNIGTRKTFADGSLDRRSFEHLLGSLVRAGLARVTEESFEKDGQRIDFQRAWLTPSAREHGVAPATAKRLSIAQAPPVKKRKKGSKKAGAKVFRKRRKG